MKYARTTLATVLILSMVGTGAALAERANADKRAAMFDEMDTNADGKLTREEAQAHRAARFATADADGDGKLNAEEFAAQAAKRSERRAARMFAKLDQDGDGFVSVDDLRGRHRADKIFDRADANEDGVISKEEFAEMRGHRRGKRHGRDAQD